MPGTKGNRNAFKSGRYSFFAAGKLPKGMGYVTKQNNLLRRAIEQAVMDIHGEISLHRQALIQAVCRHDAIGNMLQRWLREAESPTVLTGTATTFVLNGWLAAAIALPITAVTVFLIFALRWQNTRRRLGNPSVLDRGAVLRLSLCLTAPHRFALCECCWGFVDTEEDDCNGSTAALLATVRNWRISLALSSVASAAAAYALVGPAAAVLAAVIAPVLQVAWQARRREGGTYLASLRTYSRAAILSIDPSELEQA